MNPKNVMRRRAMLTGLMVVMIMMMVTGTGIVLGSVKWIIEQIRKFRGK
jgi:hypothetical protein